MKKLFLFVSALMLSMSGIAQAWLLDKSHSKLNFSIIHLLVSEKEGSFKKFDVKLSSSKEDFSDAVVELTTYVNSISTDNEKRDEHLKAPDYFDAVKFETFVFKSKSFTKVEGKKYKLIGDLTLKGVTKQVEFDVIYFGTIIHPKSKKSIAGFKITGIIKRSDFGIGNSAASSSLGDEVTITANTEFIKE